MSKKIIPPTSKPTVKKITPKKTIKKKINPKKSWKNPIDTGPMFIQIKK